MILDYNKLPASEKKIVLITIVLLAVFLLFAGLSQALGAWYSFRNGGADNIYQSVTFSGEGKVKVTPDTAKVDIGLVTEGSDSISVQNKNTEKMNAVIDFLKKDQKIDGADIKTSNYSLSPKYDYVKGKSVLAGYILNQTVTVTVRDLGKIGAILDGSVEKGANEINSVSLFVDKPEELKNKAREEAVKSAREKAIAASETAGFRLGRLVGFNEGFSGEPRIFAETLGKGGGTAPAPQIEPGSQEITVNVTMTYLIK